MNLSQLKALFSPRRYLLTSESVTATGTGRAGREGVLPRAICRHRRFDLSQLPAARRGEALSIQIAQWSPYERHGSHVAWQGAQAQVWLWSDERARALGERVGKPLGRFLPESVLSPPPDQDGPRLLRCLEGVEGQVWRQGVLTGSHWWSSPPGAAEWARFLRAEGLAAQPLPPVQAPALLDKPWGGSRMADLGGVGGSLLRREPLWVALGAFALVLALVWQGVSWLHWQSATADLEARIAALSSRAEPILDARNRAHDERDRGARLARLWPDLTHLELMAAVAEKTPAQARWVEWNYNMGTLRLTVSADQHDPLVYVGNYQSIDGVESVTTEAARDKKHFVIIMKLSRGAAGS